MNSIKLEKGSIFLMLPFQTELKTDIPLSVESSGIWTKTVEDAPKLDFLLDHVKNFFISTTPKEKPNLSSCIILKLKKDFLAGKLFNNKRFWFSNKAFDTHEKTRNFYKYPVSFDPGAFRLIYHPFTGISILILYLEIISGNKNTDRPTLEDFIQMNYMARLFNRHDEPFLISQNERPEERNKALLLATTDGTSMFEKTTFENIEYTGWRISHLINNLLQEINKNDKIILFDYNRFYPVSYVQPVEEIINDEYIHKALFYLRKVYNFDFFPALDILQRDSEIFHPFRQIYYANSLEGAAVINNCKQSDPEFIKTFFNNSFQKSLWLTILGVMQRSVFLRLLREISEIDPDNHQLVKAYLIRYTKISLKAIFSKVSVYHQHNDYYVMMINNFQINELQSELKEELYELNNILRQFHEDEVEESDKLEKKSSKRLSIILFTLSMIGLTQVVYGIIANKGMPLYQHAIAFVIPLCLGLVFWIIITRDKN